MKLSTETANGEWRKSSMIIVEYTQRTHSSHVHDYDNQTWLSIIEQLLSLLLRVAYDRVVIYDFLLNQNSFVFCQSSGQHQLIFFFTLLSEFTNIIFKQ